MCHHNHNHNRHSTDKTDKRASNLKPSDRHCSDLAGRPHDLREIRFLWRSNLTLHRQASQCLFISPHSLYLSLLSLSIPICSRSLGHSLIKLAGSAMLSTPVFEMIMIFISVSLLLCDLLVASGDIFREYFPYILRVPTIYPFFLIFPFFSTP